MKLRESKLYKEMNVEKACKLAEGNNITPREMIAWRTGWQWLHDKKQTRKLKDGYWRAEKLLLENNLIEK